MVRIQKEYSCPKCGKIDLIYVSDPILELTTLYYDYVCNNCFFEGKEWHSIKFLKHTDQIHNSVQHEDDEVQCHG